MHADHDDHHDHDHDHVDQDHIDDDHHLHQLIPHEAGRQQGAIAAQLGWRYWEVERESVATRKTVPSDRTATTGKKTKTSKPKTKPQPPTTKGGVPTPSNPSFSFALPGPAPLGVPNFFIDSFQIPPFLLPIYQAAGTQYDVPWQILAAINEIETDYGRNLSVSSAGAVGWMQFLPSTWKRYGMDVTGTGYADPYNPVDAIFAAARYLHAAGASKSIPQAIYSYNHASWYVQSVMLRAKLIGGMPNQLVGALSGLVEGHFPVAAAAKYADSAVLQKARTRVKSANAAVMINSAQASKTAANDGTNIFAKTGSPVIAVNDGKVVKVGQPQKLGNYLELQDATGNLKAGAVVVSGTIIGRVGETDPQKAPHVYFEIRPAGKGAPKIDPKPILDGWKLLESTAIYRASGKNALYGDQSSGSRIGQVLLLPKPLLREARPGRPARPTSTRRGAATSRPGQIDRRGAGRRSSTSGPSRA